VLILGLDPPAAVLAMTTAMTLPCDVSGAAHLPADVASLMPQREIAASGTALTALRLEGFAPSVAQRKTMLEAELRGFGELETASAAVSQALWRAVRDVTPFAAASQGGGRPLWRISTQATRGAELAARIAGHGAVQVLFDWAGGLIWLAPGAAEDAAATLVARALAGTGGHAMLVRGPAALRASVDVFSPQDPPLAALTRRVKESFDPRGMLNPGRMWAGV